MPLAKIKRKDRRSCSCRRKDTVISIYTVLFVYWTRRNWRYSTKVQNKTKHTQIKQKSIRKRVQIMSSLLESEVIPGIILQLEMGDYCRRSLCRWFISCDLLSFLLRVTERELKCRPHRSNNSVSVKAVLHIFFLIFLSNWILCGQLWVENRDKYW